MARVLNKIKDPQNEALLMNQNFDAIALDIAERGGIFSTVASVGGFTVTAGTATTIQVSVLFSQTDSSNPYTGLARNYYEDNQLPIIPRVTTYIDNNNDGTYIYPLGSNLTAAQKFGISIDYGVFRNVVDQQTNEKATYWIKIKNADASDHVFYLTTDVYYAPVVQKGSATRTA
jgi:hypothetical protein